MDKYINGQGRELYRSIPFGKSTVGHSGCGAIAIYNVLQGMGINVSLEDVIMSAKRLRCLFLMGFFGIWPRKLGKILSYFNLNYEVINWENSEYKAGDKFIVTIFNNRKMWYFGGLHTFEMAFCPDDRYPDKPWIALNRVDSAVGAVRYKSTADALITYGKRGKPIYGKYMQVLRIV